MLFILLMLDMGSEEDFLHHIGQFDIIFESSPLLVCNLRLQRSSSTFVMPHYQILLRESSVSFVVVSSKFLM